MKTLTITAIACLAVTANANWTYQVLWNDGSATSIDGASVGGSERWWGHGGYQYVAGYLLGVGGGFGAQYEYAGINDVYGNQQVGYGGNALYRALLWSGTPGSMLSLHPAGGWSESALEGVYDGRQVGYVLNLDTTAKHAGLWNGTASSFQDIHPAGYFHSHAFGNYENIQVGEADFQAGMWFGTVSSFVSLRPPAFAGSVAYAVHENQQVGYVNISHSNAALWYGSAGSFVNLHPAGSVSSRASDVHSGQQVGSVDLRAAYWTGSAASYVDLHSVLPMSYTSSGAGGIWDNGDQTRVVGSATDASGTKAIAWTRMNTTVRIKDLVVTRGHTVSGELNSLVASDDDRLVVRPGVVFTTNQSPVLIQLYGTSPDLNPSMLSFFLEANSSGGANIQQMIRMFDYDAGIFETVDLRQSSALDKTVRVTLTDNPGRFVGPNGELRALLGYRATGPVIQSPWSARIDYARWVVPGT